MFFIGGVSSKQVKLDFIQKMICSHCGQYGSYEVFDEYIYLSLFFIPILKWNRKYYVKSTCCGSVYSISEETWQENRKRGTYNLNKSGFAVNHQTLPELWLRN
jgi:hypothetical protein